MNAPKQQNDTSPENNTTTVLDLLVKNHPGVMTHVCSLFSRRAYNLEGIAVLPVGDTVMSRIWLKVVEENKLVQIVKQLEKLQDVQQVTRHDEAHPIFTDMAHHFNE